MPPVRNRRQPLSSPVVVSIDIGTSSVRAQVWNADTEALGPPVARDQVLVTAADGKAEIDADDMVTRVVDCLTEATRNSPSITAVGLSTFWHSAVGVHADGHAVTPILTWADTRATSQVEWLKANLDERDVHQRTGCLLHTSYLPARLRWVAENRPDWHSAVDRWLSPGEYLTLRLCGDSRTSLSMMTATGLFNARNGDWDDELLRAARVERHRLPVLNPASIRLTADWAARLPALASAQWHPPWGDGACSNVGCGAVQPGDIAIMLGTSGAVRTLASPPTDWTVPDGLWRYALDERQVLYGGALSNGGSVFAWIQRTFKIEPADTEAVGHAQPAAHNLVVLPFLAGERSPGWRGDARASIHGLSLSTRPVDILQAGMESVSYRLALVRRLLQSTSPTGNRIIATGGALVHSPVWAQMLADVLVEPVEVSREAEASSRGCARMVLEALGRDAPAVATGTIFTPRPDHSVAHARAMERQTALYRTLYPL